MRPDVRSWGPLVLAGVLAALLLALASLQWRWLGQISTDERDRMQTSLRTQVTEFTQEFDRELTRAYFWLQADRGPAPVATALDSVAHFQRWYSTAPHPALVRQIYVVSLAQERGDAQPVVSRYDREQESLVQGGGFADRGCCDRRAAAGNACQSRPRARPRPLCRPGRQ